MTVLKRDGSAVIPASLVNVLKGKYLIIDKCRKLFVKGRAALQHPEYHYTANLGLQFVIPGELTSHKAYSLSL